MSGFLDKCGIKKDYSGQIQYAPDLFKDSGKTTRSTNEVNQLVSRQRKMNKKRKGKAAGQKRAVSGTRMKKVCSTLLALGLASQASLIPVMSAEFTEEEGWMEEGFAQSQDTDHQVQNAPNPALSAAQEAASLASIDEQEEISLEASRLVSPVYRLYNFESGEHFYTLSRDEREHLIYAGWKDEGIGFYAMNEIQDNPLYRLYNPNTGDHHYTLSIEERDAVMAAGWKDEGIAWHTASSTNGNVVYRLYNPNCQGAGIHHYTMSREEYDTLTTMGWIGEEVSFYSPAPYTFKSETVNGKTGTVCYELDGQKLYGAQEIEGDWYFFDEQTGLMAQNELITNASGACIYYKADGKRASGRQVVNGQTFYFSSTDGAQVKNEMRAFRDGSFVDLDENGQAKPVNMTRGKVSYQSDPDGRIEKAVYSNPVVYRQDDGRWANVLFDHYRFRDIGCLPAVMSTIVSEFSATQTTPLELGRILVAQGYMNGNIQVARKDDNRPIGTRQAAIPWIASQYGLQVRSHLDRKGAEEILKQGGLLAACLNSDNPDFSHEVLIYGYDHGIVQVHDPYYPNNSRPQSLDSIYARLAQDHLASDAGGPLFGFLNPNLPVTVE